MRGCAPFWRSVRRRSSADSGTIMRMIQGDQSADGRRFALVVSRFNDFVTDHLQAGALAALEAAGVASEDIVVVRVPGAFEIPATARQLAETRQFAAIVCLGCLIRGATPHFDFIASAVAQGIVAGAGETGIPMTFGVLTTNSIEEAFERAGSGPSNKGWEAAAAAVEMAGVAAEITRGVPSS